MTAAWLESLATRSPQQAAAGLDGDFAIAVREPSGRTVLAVDRFAIRTLCYRIHEGRLRFAERADQLADATSNVDPQAIFDYLYFHAIPSPRTVFDNVHRLPPGHCAWFEDGVLHVEPYWTPRFEPASRASFDELKAEFRQLLHQAVARQLDGSVPACFLSGGTDSSTIAGLIGEVAGRPAAAYSIGFEAEGYDEMEYARIAARRFGSTHHAYYVTPDDLVASIPEAAAGLDQPFGNSSTLPAFICARNAHRDGITRLLAGDGGDELFGGNSRYAKQRVFDAYAGVPSPLRGVLEGSLLHTPLGRLPLARKGASYVEQARVPMPDRLQIYNLLLRLGTERVLTPNFRAAIDVSSPLAQQQAVWKAADAASPIDRTLAYDWRYTLAENDLPKVREATRLADVEVGFPLLDTDLLRFSMRLPAHYKLRGFTLRWFFKEALRGFLPDEIIAKKKHGFGLPFGVWALRNPGLRELAFDSLASLARRDIVEPAFIDELRDRRLAEHPGYYGEMVWVLMMLEQWLEQNGRRSTVAASA
ncbi:asparagine synthetase B family protein [Piscinibacter koreensis]|uniref:asparagine synthetase B family protein n=1 Tax=Piscinibacter koreensis TaxID=2742824 RepID=UPI0031596063